MTVLLVIFVGTFVALMIAKWWIGSPPPNKKGDPEKGPLEGR